MNFTTIIAGLLALVYGIFTLVERKRNPKMFWKLDPMKKIWGDKLGKSLHFFGYTLIPIILGIVLIIAGFVGVGIF